MEILHSFLIISLYFLKILSIISQKLSIISQKTLYNLSKNSLHILSFNLSLYSHSIIKIILTHDHLGMNFTFVLVSYHAYKKNLKLHHFGTLIGACCNIQLALVLSTIAGQNWGPFLTLEIRSFILSR